MAQINEILNNNNIGIDFVVHIKNENELNALIDVLMSRKFNIQLSLDFGPEQLDLWMKDIAKEEGHDLCFRIRNREADKCVAFNPSVEYWRAYGYTILESYNDELYVNDGSYSLEDAKIEAAKLYKHREEYSEPICDLFGLGGYTTDEEIIDKIAALVGYTREELSLPDIKDTKALINDYSEYEV